MRKEAVFIIVIILLSTAVSSDHQYYRGPVDLTDAEFFSLLKPTYETYDKAQLRNYFMTRVTPQYFPLSNYASQDTFNRANNAMNEEIITYAGSPYDFSDGTGGFNWNLIPAGDLGLDAAAYLHRFYHMNNIANAYAHTSTYPTENPIPDESYVNEIIFEWDEYWNEFFKVTPIYHFPAGPEFLQLNGLLNHFERIRNWIETFEYIGPVHESPTFDENEVVEYLKKLYMSIEYIRSNEVQWPITSNQVITGKASVLYAGIMYPEFDASDEWLQYGKNGLEEVITTDIFDDGCHNERTPGYNHVALMSLMTPYNLAALNGISFSSAYNQRLEKSLNFIKYLMHPNNIYVPAIGDTSIQEGFSIWLDDGYTIFGDQTFRYVETFGAQGTMPSETSKAFANCKYYILRSGWGQPGNIQSYKDQRHLVFDAARFAGSHSDWDNLNIILFAYDKLLLADPGEYILNGPDKAWFESTAAHNTIVVDNRNYNLMNNIPPTSPNPDFESEVTTSYNFGDGFDFVKGSHNGYAINTGCSGCPITNPVVITRNIFYPKLGENLDYFIVSDKMLGSGTHTYDQYWHLASPIGSVSFDSNKVAISPNLIIAPADPSELIQSIDNTHWLSYTYATRENKPIVNYKKSNIAGSETYDTVIFPFKTDQPSILVNRLPVTVSGNPVETTTASALDIYVDRAQDFRDYYYISHDTLALRNFGNYQTDSELSFVRKDNLGNVKRIIMKNGDILKEGNSDLVVVNGNNVIVDSIIGTTSDVKISASGQLTSFKVFAPLASSVLLNGNPLTFIQNGDYIQDSLILTCTLSSAVIRKQDGSLYISGDHVIENTPITLEVTTQNCVDVPLRQIKFEIFEVDNGIIDQDYIFNPPIIINPVGINNDGVISADWTLEYRTDANEATDDQTEPDEGLEYKFVASIIDDPTITSESSNWINGIEQGQVTLCGNAFVDASEQCDESAGIAPSNGCLTDGICASDCQTCYYESADIITLVSRGNCIDDNDGDRYGQYEETTRTVRKSDGTQVGIKTVTKECYITEEVDVPFFDLWNLVVVIFLIVIFYAIKRSKKSNN